MPLSIICKLIMKAALLVVATGLNKIRNQTASGNVTDWTHTLALKRAVSVSSVVMTSTIRPGTISGGTCGTKSGVGVIGVELST